MEHLEGRQSVLAALQVRQRRFEVILLKSGAHEDRFDEVLALAESLAVPVRRVDARELDSLAHGSSHGGMIAIVSPKPRTSVTQLLEILDRLSDAPLLLLLEGVDDARNLGFTLRSAEALGVHAVLVKKHLWDFDAIEVARPASGAYERIPLVQIDDTSILETLIARGFGLFGCVANAKRQMYDVDLREPTILAIGGEKRGLSGAVRSICTRLITIPTTGGASSLSLSHATAIVLAEAMRQRHPPNNVGAG